MPQALFLRLNCEGCEFEVVTAPEFAQVANKIRFIGGEIHETPEQQQLVGGKAKSVRAVEQTFEGLCTDKFFKASQREFASCRNLISGMA